ncbi:GntR family transcriptional regulator [Brevibacillus massiliensis]|jgi:DNA-binding GntR family transcriptional regulator|uniref:GntR family transcriptional regulator n=1 Tax=Brevibacillus massiliensis TaxID=1118054 RepID=UPI0002F9125A|nr:GntR family transcriptional regulator [Brevibacillus massiliensis]
MGGQTEYAFHFMKEKIISGTFKPSQKLTEIELAKMVGVSRNTIKKALMMLERENLVEVKSNKGAIIKSFSFEEIINYLEIREVLEGLVARSAARNIGDGDIEKLEEFLREMKTQLQEHRFDEYSRLNREFHNVIYSASKNTEAVAMIYTIKTQLNQLHYRTILVPGRTRDSYEEHERILEAIKAGKEKAAEDAIKEHVANVRRTIVENYFILA